ncbi:MAG TPA: hypothetical protein VKA34_22775 [Balneolales bacterium]|nr:hypothetical protein [Balneolales bacterium]
MSENNYDTGSDRIKKIIIIVLLLLSCFISIYLLLQIPDNNTSKLESLSQADTLIMRELHAFDIHQKQIHIWSVKVNKKFSRKIYDIALPPEFSKTFLHAELNRRLEQYGVQTPAHVYFPEKNMDIEIYYKGTVIRTLRLKTDTSLVMHRYPGTILAYFNHQPDPNLIQQFRSIGETLPIVFHVTKATEGRNWVDALKLKNQPIIYWIQKNFEYHDTHNRSDWYLNRQLKILNKIVSNPTILITPNLDETTKNMIEKDGEVLGLSIIRPGHTIFDDKPDDQLQFKQGIQKFSKDATEGKRPILLIKASQNTFKWVFNTLPELKKGGLVLVPPIIDHY